MVDKETEFDRWSKKEYYTYDALCRTDAMELAWKAALEWVLADLKAAREGFDLGLFDTLNKELEETENDRIRKEVL